MNKRENHSTTLEELRERVHHRLQELGTRQQGIEPLRDLFLRELNYDYKNQRLPLPDEKSRRLVREEPVIIATGGDGDFKIIYIHLRDTLSLSSERTLISKLLPNHIYALFIFSNAAQNRWHFVNVKDGSSPTKRHLFRRITIGPEERLRTAVERIAMLDLTLISPNESTIQALSIQDAYDKAFDVEAVTRRFYSEYRIMFDILQKDLFKQTNDDAWAHDYALQFLNRCMFLYFIQRKRWLGDDTEFLKLFWKAYHEPEHEKDTFVSQWLNILFFKAFNDQYNETYNHFPQHIHDILMLAPYLNGGLFTENGLDKKHSFTMSDMRFEQVFNLLERYNFTISEDSPLDQEVAVDPEMIGTVYESLVNVSTEVDERSDAGIFYTPRTEIDLMCRLSLVDYMTNNLGQEHKSLLYETVFAIELEDKELVDQRLADAQLWQKVYDLLNDVTVVDPACGSGAFLVGMLSVLDDMIERAVFVLKNEHEYNPYNAYERKKRCIGQSLYGVDVMEWAVHVAELRLWLSLIVEADYEREQLHVRNEPLLPYFTFKVRCGDSLVQEIEGIKLGLKQRKHNLSPSLKRRVTRLKIQKRDFYNNIPSRELRTKEDVQHEEQRLFHDIIDERIKTLNKEIRVRRLVDEDKQQAWTGEDESSLKFQSLTLTPEQQREIQWREQERDNLLRMLDKLNEKKIIPFVWDIAFVEIFAEDQRFDIVIGNPPYVRQEKIAAPRTVLNERPIDNKTYKAKLIHSVYDLFPRFFGYNEAKNTAQHQMNGKSDLYIYFYLHGLSLLNNKGTFCFITSNSWLDVGYGADLQEFLLKHCHIKLILDNETKRSFANASVNTIIALFSPPNESSEWGLEQTARFVMSRVPFEQLLSSEIFEDIESAQERETHPEYRVFPISQQKLLEDGRAALNESDEEEQDTEHSEKTISSPLLNVAKYTGNKWGGKYLRAPEIYWTIMEKGKDKLVRLGDIAKVSFGIKTGANEFFYLDEAKARQWKIEQEFLVPAIKSPRECRSILIDPQSLKSKLFMCHKSKAELKDTAALQYINWGESQDFNKGPSCAGRKRWWNLGERRVPFLSFNYLIDTTAKTFYAPDGCYFSDNFQDINISTQLILPLCASLNSTVFQLMVNVAGRSNFGDGLLKIQTYEVSNLLCLHPREIAMRDSQVFASTNWNVLTPSQERIALDSIIFDALSLTQGERDAVYEGVINLVNARLEKAKSFNVAKETRKRVESVRQLNGIWIGIPDVEDEEVVEGYSA